MGIRRADGALQESQTECALLKLAALKFRIVPFTKKVEGTDKTGETVTMPYYKAPTEPTSAELEERTPFRSQVGDERLHHHHQNGAAA
jgi:hypothetical protein